MGQALDEMARKYIRELIEDDKDDEYVRREIKRLLQRTESSYQYDRNVELIKWMRYKDWNKTAAYLENYLEAESAPSSCFPGETKILTSFGYKPIKSFLPGDSVYSWNSARCILVSRQVTQTLRHQPSRIAMVKFKSDRDPPRATKSHSVLSQKGWLRIAELKPGDNVIEAYPRPRSSFVVQVVELPLVEPTFNLITSGEHNFIVEGLVAHNFTFLRRTRTFVHRMIFDHLSIPHTPKGQCDSSQSVYAHRTAG